jgi:hypothetical protein
MTLNQVYVLWKTGYSVNTALSVELVFETEKAFKFKVLNSVKNYTFYMPKSAVKKDEGIEGVLNIAHWFNPEGFTRFLFDQYANHHVR